MKIAVTADLHLRTGGEHPERYAALEDILEQTRDIGIKHLIITGNQQIKVKDLLIMIKEIFRGEIEIEFGREEDLNHYEITPYAYRPQVARKLVPQTHHDLGQGLLELIYDLQEQFEKEKTPVKVSLRSRKRENN